MGNGTTRHELLMLLVVDVEPVRLRPAPKVLQSRGHPEGPRLRNAGYRIGRCSGWVGSRFTNCSRSEMR
jgi:hypothetical protein